MLADRLPISRPATSQHLRVLEAAELVTATTIGTRHEYRIDPTGLQRDRAESMRIVFASPGGWPGILDTYVTAAGGSPP